MNERTTTVIYKIEADLGAAEFRELLYRSGLAARRPAEQPDTLSAMLRHADVVVTARHGEQLIGVSRALTDFSYCTYLSDLAVDVAFQRQGIGTELLRRTHQAAGLHTTLILLAAPQAVTYYAHIGMAQHPSCWTIPPAADE